ncbi:S8 family serine peptidase [Haloarchaeobius sp. TZWSO28]|uniref:S8 family serine peptidase n=1 Tax=Haloarchaeobius sp. TZWSO28 TaxID=3446119 RepID=UPI003EC00101
MQFSRRQLLRGLAGSTVGLGLAPAAASAVTGEHIVGTSDAVGLARAREVATRVSREFDFGPAIGQALVGTFPAAALDGLRRNPHVRYVEANGTMQATGQTVPWGIERVGAMTAQAAGQTGVTGSGTPVHVAIVDTGIDSDHPDLQAVVGAGASFVACESCGVPNTCHHGWDDDDGHGTHVAGTVAAQVNDLGVVGVAPGVQLHAVKVLNCNGGGSFENVAAGIQYVADQGWDVANMSLGGGDSNLVSDAVDYAVTAGVTLVASAGNGGCTDCVGYPAAYPDVIAVSASDEGDGLASFSSTGPEVDLIAPGVGVRSALAGGSYGLKNGTSMSCPHVTAAVALLLASGYTGTQARQQLQATADDLGLSAAQQGAGLVRVDRALGVEPAAGTLPTVLTDPAGGVSGTTAQLRGRVTDLGTAGDVTAYFEWGLAGTGLTMTTPAQTVSATGEIVADLTGLTAGSAHEFQLVTTNSAGFASGDTLSFLTTGTAPEPPVVLTGDPTDVTGTAATLRATLADLGSAQSVEAWFRYRPVGGSWTGTTPETLTTAPTGYSAQVTGLTDETTYEGQALVSGSDGSDSGAIRQFTTLSGTPTPPSIDAFTASDTSGNNPHADIRGEWTVSDPNGDIQSVVYAVYEGGALVDSVTRTATGVTTADSATIHIHKGGGRTYEARLTVTDGSTTVTKSVVVGDGGGDPGTPPTVVTEPASAVTETTADLTGQLTDLGSEGTATVYFEWGEAGSRSVTTPEQVRSETGQVTATLTDLTPGTEYEYRIVGENSAGSMTGDVAAFTTAGTAPEPPAAVAPEVVSFAVAEAGAPSPHAEVTGTWEVTDSDGDLAEVVFAVFDEGGASVGTVGRSVSGGQHSDSATVQVKKGGGQTYTATLTVTDATGRTASATRSVAAAGKGAR